MYQGEASSKDMTRMELLPVSAPVYGGGLVVAFLPEDYQLPDDIRAFLVFKGTRQRQVTEAKVSLEDNAFHAVIPDHEPPERVELSVYIQSLNEPSECIGTEEFTYHLDQTCFLARYLADSVHSLSSLEDWDSIQGPHFSLEKEDFPTLDERLTSAFQHLILPPDWNLLGDPSTETLPRETLFHFASRLGLSTFVTLLLEKPGALQCLRLKNRHGDLATDIAHARGFDGLADLITDPHAHGVIRWENKEKIGQAVILKRHSFGTISTTSECQDNVWPPLEEEILALSKSSAPPATPIPYQLESTTMWEDDLDDSLPPLPPRMYCDHEYDVTYEATGAVHPSGSSDGDYRSRGSSRNKEGGDAFLMGNLSHLQEISDGIRCLRHRDIERLNEENDDETNRLSSSCPDLAKDLFPPQQYGVEEYDPPRTPIIGRNRRALPLDINEKQLEAQLLAPEEGFPKVPLDRDQFVDDHDKREPNVSNEPSPTSLQRRHSWHSAESLDADMASPSEKKRFSFNEEDEDQDKKTNVTSPTIVRRAAHKNMTMFTVVASTQPTQEEESVADETVSAENRRSKSVSVNNNNNSAQNEPDRRFTISEGLIPEDHRNSLRALQKLISKTDGEDKADVSTNASAVSMETTSPDPAAEPSNPQDRSTQRPPVPRRPPKKLITRKPSFLDKMKSAKNKQKDKAKIKSFAELKFGVKQKEEKDSFNGADVTKDIKNKAPRPSIIQPRPHSMMLNLPAQYPVGNPATDLSGTSPSSRMRPTSTFGYPGNPMITDSIQTAGKRSSYHEEEDGPSSAMAYLTNFRDRERISGSYESLDEGSLDAADIESDLDLMVRNDEPDSWSAALQKKSLKRLSLTKKEIKRQENIFEFIQTEKNHLTTLKIMQKVYSRGLAREVHTDIPTISRLFPLIDEHVEFVAQFVQKLTERQNGNKVVSGIGDILVAQWSNSNGETMKKLFGDFCSKQNEITNLYKELMKNDKKFQAFMKKWDKNPITRRQDIPACALLITQRITKYPIMLQTLIENSNKKDHKDDYQSLEKSLELSREIAKAVDELVQAHEREQLLLEIYDKTETKSSSTYKDGRKFDRKDLLKRNRKLLHSATVQWNVKDNKKFTDIFILLLSDCIVFLQDNNGRYAFPSGQPAVVPLQRMIVREVAGDDKGLYLMSMTTQLMYSIKLPSVDDCKTLMHTIRLAIGTCPDEDDGTTSEDEVERRLHEQRLAKVNQAIRQLEHTDQRINMLLEEKMSLFKTLADSVDRGGAVSHLHFRIPYYPPGEMKLPPGTPLLLNAIAQVTKLSDSFYNPKGLSRHPSSVGENENSSRSPSLPKRSDTFGGFDHDKEPASPRAKWMNSSQSDSRLTELEPLSSESSSRNRDSGLMDSDTVTQHSGSQSSIPKAWEPCSDSPNARTTPGEEGQGRINPTTDQVAALTSLAHILSEYQSCAAQQDTLVEKLHNQLSSSDRNVVGKKRSVGGTLQEAELKRNQIKQQEQMDQLRKQQNKLRQEQEHWQKKVERYERSFENDKKEFEQQKAKFASEREETEKLKIEIQKAKDEYQRDLARLRDAQRKTQHDHGSTSSLTSTNRNNSSNYVTDSNEFKPDILKPSRSQSSLQISSLEFPSNKKPPSPTYTSDYPRTFPGNKRDPTPSVPLHLQGSATNQPAGYGLKHQDINSKLSKLASNTKLKTPSGGEKGGLHQLMKLSKLTNQNHGSTTSLENLKNFASFTHHRRKHVNTVPESHQRSPHTDQVDWPPAIDVSVERSGSTSSREGEKKLKPGEKFNGFKPKSDHNSAELFL